MIDLYYWTTPNGHKITIFLEETGLPYTIRPVDIGKGEQFGDAFLKISPNNKIPAIVDNDPDDGAEPISLFESGAILRYLADKAHTLLPDTLREREEALAWLFWQVGHLGPMLGQNHHFANYAPEKIPYAIERYRKETERLYGVLDDHLGDRNYIAREYSIADIACYPWIVPHERQGQNLADYPNLQRWFTAIGERPAVKEAYRIAEEMKTGATVTDDSRAILFGQGRRRHSGR